MKEKIKRILDLIRAGKLTLDDASPLLAALSSKLALSSSDRELLASLLAREDLESAQVAEHLMLLRGLRDAAPFPPQPPRAPRGPRVLVGGRPVPGMDGFVDRLTGSIDGFVDRITDQVERAVDSSGPRPPSGGGSRILRISVESSEGDSYNANLPLSLAPHLHKLIPPHGIEALSKAGFTLEGLQLLIEANPPNGTLIDAEDSEGNSIQISLK